MKLGIVGSRSITNKVFLEDIMKRFPEPDLIVSGGAAGADSLAQTYAKEQGISILVHNAKWRPQGVYDKGAGFKRNVKIIDDSDLVIVLYDGDSSGALHDVNLCISKKVDCKIYPYGEPKEVPFKKDVYGFDNKAQWLSNLWFAPVKVGEYTFPSAQNAFYAARFWKSRDLMLEFCDIHPAKAEVFSMLMQKERPKDADPAFFGKREAIMERTVRRKFVQNPYLKCKLKLSEGFDLENANDWGDDYWGTCRGIGENRLGKILMKLREEFLKYG